MDKKFAAIKEEYDKFYKSIWIKGETQMRDNEVGLWGNAACDAVFDRLDQQRQAYKSELQDNCKQAEQIIEKIKTLDENSDEVLERAKKEFHQLQKAFSALGALPRDTAASKIDNEL